VSEATLPPSLRRTARAPASTQTARNADPGHGSAEPHSACPCPAIRASALYRLVALSGPSGAIMVARHRDTPPSSRAHRPRRWSSSRGADDLGPTRRAALTLPAAGVGWARLTVPHHASRLFLAGRANAVTSGPGDGVPRWGPSMRHRPTDRCVRWNGMERATQVDERPAQAREASVVPFSERTSLPRGMGRHDVLSVYAVQRGRRVQCRTHRGFVRINGSVR
jgi:hypothetical protein